MRWRGRKGGGTNGACAQAVCCAALLLTTPALGGTLTSPGCQFGGTAATVTAISPSLDLELTDGRTVRIPGLDPVDPDPGEHARSALSAWLIGRTVSLNVRAAEPDRWGRTLALVFADLPGDAAAPVSVGEAMIDAGYARIRPDTLAAPCWATYQALETSARLAGLGAWRNPLLAVTAANDSGKLSRQTGSMAIVEGRISTIRTGRARTYLAFDGQGRSGFAIAVDRRLLLQLTKAGTELKTWVGRTVRVRGFLDDRFGLQIELSSLDQVEFTEP